jgi:hypothetical protein
VRDLRPLTHAAHAPQPRASDRRGPFDVALAAELGKRGQTNAERGSRLVVVGTSNLAWTRNWQDPAALGNRLFVESAVSWLAARPLLVSVPDKATHEVGLALTEDSLSEVMRYVLLYLPGSAAALGLLVMLRRRSSERRSRRLSGGPDQKSGFSSDGRKPSENEPSAARGE